MPIGSWARVSAATRPAARLALASLALVAGVATAVSGLGPFGGEAAAATYRVIECARELGAPHAPDAVAVRTVGSATPWNFCGTGTQLDGLHVTGSVPQTNTGALAGWRFEAPPQTRLVAARVSAKGQARGGVDPELWVWNTAARPVTGVRFGDEGNVGPAAAERSWDGEEGPMDVLELRLACTVLDPPGSVACDDSGDAFVNVTEIALTLEDLAPPAVTALDGPLVADPRRSVRGTVAAAIAGADRGGGLHRATLEAAGRTVAAGGYECDLAAAGIGRRLVPCPTAATRTLAVDTTAPGFHIGLNPVRACVLDFAGQAACAERLVRVDNACPSNAFPVRLKKVRIAGRGVAKRARAGRRTVARHGRGLRVSGRVVDSDGDPVRGAAVCLGLRPLDDRFAAERVEVERSGRRGRFRFRLRPGPNRRLRVVAWAGSQPAEAFRTLLVRARPRLRIVGARRPGGAISFRVRLNRPLVGGQRVEIRARADAGWVGVPGCDHRANRRGRFRCRFEIPPTAQGARLRFRAVVIPSRGYPYLRGSSPIRTVVVGR